MRYIETNDVLYAGMTQVINRGTAEILEEDESGIFLRDTLSNAYMLAADDSGKEIRWLRRHEDRGYELMVVFREELVSFIREHYGLKQVLDCYQAVYRKPEAPEIDRRLDVKKAQAEDFPIIAEHYRMLEEAEIREIIRRGELFIGYCEGKAVGFIGMHLEGSMGLLEILPEYQGRGYGTELEGRLISYQLERGQIPFCQIVADNVRSLGLQKKLGLTIAEEHMYWVF